eukprot:scaffold43621_cov22-Cyclotella_meneghiniana.AAC.1
MFRQLVEVRGSTIIRRGRIACFEHAGSRQQAEVKQLGVREDSVSGENNGKDAEVELGQKKLGRIRNENCSTEDIETFCKNQDIWMIQGYSEKIIFFLPRMVFTSGSVAVQGYESLVFTSSLVPIFFEIASTKIASTTNTTTQTSTPKNQPLNYTQIISTSIKGLT